MARLFRGGGWLGVGPHRAGWQRRPAPVQDEEQTPARRDLLSQAESR